MGFLDSSGVARLWQHIIAKLGNKVDKEIGKGLSTNDYTTTEKNKLAGIAEGANKTIVDSALSSTSTDPVQNKVVNAAINDLNTLVGDTAVSTQISDYAAPKSHTHNYAGSSSAGGAANVSESDIGITTAGTGSAYTATVPGITALTSGVSFIMVPHVVSASTTPTLNVNNLGAKNIKRRLSSISTSVQSGYSNTWLAKGTPFRVTYDGTQWIVDGLTKPAVADLYGTLSIEKGGTGATTATGALTNLGAVPTYRKINGHNLATDIELTATDVGAVSPEDLQAEGYITGISGADVLDALGYTPVDQATLGDFTGASATQAGDTGLVPAPSVGDQSKFLRGDGTWATVSTSGGITGDYLPLTGGTLTGNLTVNGAISVNTANRAATAENILADKGGVASDANACITVGVYATNTSTTNLPFSTYGTLTVYKSAQNWIIQIWTSSTSAESSMYMRKNINGEGFGSWHKLLGSDSPVSIAQGGTGGTKLEEAQKNLLDGTYPAEGTDLSKFAPGIYCLPNDSNTIANVPAVSWSPMAFVFGHQNNDTAADGSPTGAYFQGYLNWEGELWLRRRKWDGWGNWLQIISSNGGEINGGTLTVSKTSGFNYSGIEEGTSDAFRNVWFSDTGAKGKPCYHSGLLYNPGTRDLAIDGHSVYHTGNIIYSSTQPSNASTGTIWLKPV